MFTRLNRDCIEIIFESLGSTEESRLRSWASGVSRVSREFGLVVLDMIARIPPKARTVARLRNVEVDVRRAESMGILPLDQTVRCRKKGGGLVVLSFGDLVERMNDEEYDAFFTSNRMDLNNNSIISSEYDEKSFENMYELVFDRPENRQAATLV